MVCIILRKSGQGVPMTNAEGLSVSWRTALVLAWVLNRIGWLNNSYFITINTPTMKQISYRFFAITLAFAMLSASILSCSSTTMIQTIPPGAKIYLNDEFKGVTPYKHTDQAISGTSTQMTFRMEGYEDFHTILSKNETVNAGAIVGGIFFMFPFIWTMGYNPSHTYELFPTQ